MTRPHPSKPTLGMIVECLFRKFPILCGICGERIDWDADKAWDHHPVEWADGGEHCASNLRPVHTSPCHRVKSISAEKQRSRIDRLERVKNGLPKRARDLRKKKWPSRPMQSRNSFKRSAPK